MGIFCFLCMFRIFEEADSTWATKALGTRRWEWPSEFSDETTTVIGISAQTSGHQIILRWRRNWFHACIAGLSGWTWSCAFFAVRSLWSGNVVWKILYYLLWIVTHLMWDLKNTSGRNDLYTLRITCAYFISIYLNWLNEDRWQLPYK